MPRRPRFAPIGVPQHVIQRGNNRNACFTTDNDFAAYSNWLAEAARRYEVSIHAWVYMTNHVHLLVTPHRVSAVSSMMQFLGRHYVRYFNSRYDRTGTLWEGRYKSCLVEQNNYFLICQRYIELNPVRAGLVRDPANYHWSSYQFHAFGVQSSMASSHDLYLSLGQSGDQRRANYRSLFDSELQTDLITDLRYATNSCLAFGSKRFQSELATLSNGATVLKKRGPAAKPAVLESELESPELAEEAEEGSE